MNRAYKLAVHSVTSSLLKKKITIDTSSLYSNRNSTRRRRRRRQQLRQKRLQTSASFSNHSGLKTTRIAQSDKPAEYWTKPANSCGVSRLGLIPSARKWDWSWSSPIVVCHRSVKLLVLTSGIPRASWSTLLKTYTEVKSIDQRSIWVIDTRGRLV